MPLPMPVEPSFSRDLERFQHGLAVNAEGVAGLFGNRLQRAPLGRHRQADEGVLRPDDIREVHFILDAVFGGYQSGSRSR